jgi:RimK family alpha-L-glutamate ligase
MNLCVLASDDSWHLQDLRRAARADEQIDNLRFNELADILVHRPHRLTEYDCLLTRAMPSGSLQQVVFRMDILLMLERHGLRIVNPPRAIEMAVDKYLSLTRLQESGIAIPPTAACQTAVQALRDFDQLGGDVVCKPLFGSMGRGLERINCVQRAREKFSQLERLGDVIYQQAFIPHDDFDFRLLVIGDRVWGMKRINPQHWISNLAQGAIGVPHAVDQRQELLAVTATRAVSASVAGVDVVVDQRTGEALVVEVNSAPSWRGISAALGVDFGRELLDFLTIERPSCGS